MKRTDISRLQRNRGIHLKIGFLTAISLVLLAFNYTAYDIEARPYVVEPFEEPFVPIVRTPHSEKQKLPPPKFTASAEPELPDTPEFTPEPLVIAKKPTVGLKEPAVPTEPVTSWEEPIIRKAPPPPPVKEPEAPMIFVENMPRFPGCEGLGLSKKEREQCATKELLKFVMEEYRIPPLAKDHYITGTVVVRFVVGTDGSISNIEVVKDIGGGCGAEAVRVLEKMPKWIPGSQQGRKVPVQYNLPIKVHLQ